MTQLDAYSASEPLAVGSFRGLVRNPEVPLGFASSSHLPGNLVARFSRCLVPEDGTLHDVGYAVSAQSGNVIIMVFDCGEASAGNYTKLWDSGSLAVAAAGTWQTADPNLAGMKGGQHLMCGLVFDNAVAGYFRPPALFANAWGTLPANFIPDAGNIASRRLSGSITLGSFAAPASITAAGMVNNISVPVMLGRVA